MKKILFFGTALCIATTALAFGGVFGGGSKSSHRTSGVNAIGSYYNGEGGANVEFRSCDSETEELVGSECLPKCPEGLERNTDNSCTICKNKNVYLSYNVGAECDIALDMNQRSCDDGCWCCDESRNQCVAPDPLIGGCAANGSTYCVSNKDCKNEENTFCYMLSSDDDCEIFDTGSCISMGEAEVIGDFIKSSFTMNWKSAENWCWAHGRQLVSLADLGLSRPADWECYNEDCGFSMETWENLRNTFGAHRFWVERLYTCEAGMVDLESNYIIMSLDSIDPGEYVLCK